MPFPSQPRTVVTGAGSGLGRAFCRELAARGARILASDIDLDAVQATVGDLGGAESHAVRCDVTALDDVEKLAQEAENRFGGVDLVINNAGVAAGGRIGEVPIDNWRWELDITLWGVIYGCHVFLPRLRKQGSGHLLNIASAAGLIATPNLGPYNVAKAGVVALSETLYCELTAEEVGVSVLCPTFFETKIGDSARIEGDPAMRGMIRGLMKSASVQAAEVARIALDRAARGDLYILPHRDGRFLWRLKRMSPPLFHRLLPKLLAIRTRKGVKSRLATKSS